MAPMRRLTICIPTYERAEELDRQLAWLHAETRGREHDLEVLVSDNCSSDHTPEIVAAWAERFAPVTFRSQRHPENIGWMRNFSSCYETADGRYCWLVGDDDKVDPGAVEKVLSVIDLDPELSLLYLNFYGRAADTGEIIGEHWFDPALADLGPERGLEIFQRSIEGHFGAVIFISSTIIRTDLALEGIRRWPAALENWGGVAYWCALGAVNGRVYVTRETFVECTLGQSVWQKDPLAWFRIRHRDIPQVYRQMRSLGYQRGFCARKIAKTAQEDLVGGEARVHLKEWFTAFRRRPMWTLGVFASYVSCLASVLVSR